MIEGKLTAEWRADNPDIEPASELLVRIQAEKDQLIKDKIIKKQKPLPAISEVEKPFELPEGWVWCRLRDFSTHYVDCPHDTPKYQGKGFLCLRAPDITENGLLINTIRRVSNEEYQTRIRRLKPVRNDLVYIREGGRLGIAGLIDTDDPVCLGQRVMMLRFLDEVSAKYSLRFLNAPDTYNDVVGKTIGSASPHVNVRDIIAHVAPIPPLPEQKAIVAKVEKLLAVCDQLESQITSNQSHVNALMQAVLKEAFTMGDTQTSKPANQQTSKPAQQVGANA
ncbi:MAG: restriction endonuclease subunit S [Sedimenticola sp.]